MNSVWVRTLLGVSIVLSLLPLHDALVDQRRARNWAALGFASAGVGALFTIAGAWLGRGTDVATSARVTPNGATATLRGSL